jgi:hypothetical protein
MASAAALTPAETVNMLQKGVYCYPASKRYGRADAVVKCDWCNASPLAACLGLGTRDMCMTCVSTWTSAMVHPAPHQEPSYVGGIMRGRVVPPASTAPLHEPLIRYIGGGGAGGGSTVTPLPGVDFVPAIREVPPAPTKPFETFDRNSVVTKTIADAKPLARSYGVDIRQVGESFPDGAVTTFIVTADYQSRRLNVIANSDGVITAVRGFY